MINQLIAFKSSSLKTALTTLKIFTFPLLIAVTGCSNDETQTVVNLTDSVLQEEFNEEGTPSSSIWSYDIGTGTNGWGNNELEYYTDRTENVKVENGNLVITAIKENYEGAAYTSGRLKTKTLFEQQYGRVEARMKLPYGKGMWPAFWMLGNNSDEVVWPACGEIDIMEYRGQEPTVLHGSVHGPGYSGDSPITKSYKLTNDRFDTGFHVFGIEWTPEHINYYVDDVLYSQITKAEVEEKGTWVFDRPFYIIINLAVGGAFLGAPDDETVFPQDLLVDYVRVFKYQ